MIDKILGRILQTSVIGLLLLGLMLIYFLTMNGDEAWLISYYQEIHNGKIFFYKMAPNSLTAGGIFVLLNVLLVTLFGIHLWIFRLVSYFSLLAITFILWRWSSRQSRGRRAASKAAARTPGRHSRSPLRRGT